MAIDAGLNAGLITDTQARECGADLSRGRVAAETGFSADANGASKCVEGGAIAEPIITVNLVGGIVIGVLESGMDISEAMITYALLTIGDGLAAQIPARLMAMATGMIVTRSNASADMGSIASQQLTQ